MLNAYICGGIIGATIAGIGIYWMLGRELFKKDRMLQILQVYVCHQCKSKCSNLCTFYEIKHYVRDMEDEEI